MTALPSTTPYTPSGGSLVSSSDTAAVGVGGCVLGTTNVSQIQPRGWSSIQRLLQPSPGGRASRGRIRALYAAAPIFFEDAPGSARIGASLTTRTEVTSAG